MKSSMPDYTVLSLDDSYEWTALIKQLQQNQQDVYYTPEYYSMYQLYGDGTAQCFVFTFNNEFVLYPYLINPIRTLGYQLDQEYFDIQGAYGYNGAISSCQDERIASAFNKAFNQYCNSNNIIAEFTRFNPLNKNMQLSRNRMDIAVDRKTVILELDRSYEDIWDNSYSSKNRNMVRKARTNGYKLICDNSEAGVEKFYSIYKQTMHHINADPYYHFNMEMMIQAAQNDAFHFLFVCDRNQNILATMILIHYGIYAHYHLSGRTIPNSDNSISNFMLDEAIKIAIKRKAKVFHLGGGNSLDYGDSLFRFKKGFSKQFLDFHIGKKVHNSRVYNEIVKQWKEYYSESYSKNSRKLLGYRNI